MKTVDVILDFLKCSAENGIIPHYRNLITKELKKRNTNNFVESKDGGKHSRVPRERGKLGKLSIM